MKSYLAKLAARATLENTTASPVVKATKLFDPFEVANETSERGSRPSQPMTLPDTLNPVIDKSRLPASQSSDHSTTLLTKPPTPGSPAHAAADNKRDAPQSKMETKSLMAERSILEPDLPREILPLPLQPVAQPPTHSTRIDSAEAASPATEIEHVEDQLAEIRQEQVKLLRKADSFMERLLDRRTQSTSAEIHSGDESRSSVKTKVQFATAQRLQPVPAVKQVREQNSAQPSLVIGKLTVEVVPPAPAPVLPPQQIVVVRGGRGGRNGIPSSRRFGLGQF